MPELSYVQLSWEDPTTSDLQRPLLAAPIAIGREALQMPTHLGDQAISHLELPHKQVSRFHALITVVNNQICITDKSANGTFLNGRAITQDNQPFSSRDTLRIGPYKITAVLMREKDQSATELTLDRTHAPDTIRNNAVLVWLVGLGVLLLAGAGTWLAVSTLLERSRPQLAPSSSRIDEIRDQRPVAMQPRLSPPPRVAAHDR